MERYRYREELEFIHHQIALLPKTVQDIIKGTHFITSYDPYFLGIPDEGDGDGRDASEDCFATIYDGIPTIILTSKYVFDRLTLLHELGHIALENLRLNSPATMIALNDYAAINYHECYATGFQSFLTVGEVNRFGFHNWEELLQRDEKSFFYFVNLFRKTPHLI